MPDIWFPYLGIEIDHLDKYAFSIGSYSIAWYGIIISLGVVLALLLARHLARKSDQDPDLYVDFLIFALIFGLIGARLYYVAFEWENYKKNLISILDIRGGGLAIYGGVIAAVITAVVFARVKKVKLIDILDTCMPGLALGQGIGRWGNFFNQEAFGCYTDGLFAMRLNRATAAYTTPELTKMGVKVGDVYYIQVHPTFLYESVGCLLLVLIMVFLFKRRKFKGEVCFTYMIGYGILRAFIENLRTDQLLIWNTNWPISVFVSIAMAAAGVVLMIIFGRKAALAKKKVTSGTNEFAPDLDTDDDDDETEKDDFDKLAEEDDEQEAENTTKESASEDSKENAEEDGDASDEKEAEQEDKKPSEDDLWEV